MLTLAEIIQARALIQGRVLRTPMVSSATLGRELGGRVSLKLECLQKTGSFKPRGAFAKMLSLSAVEKARGVVAVSGGNHAQGVAFAAQQLGIRAMICMPSTTPVNYLEATRGYGAEIVFAEDIHRAFHRAEELQASGMTLVHPFDDRHVAAGQGTLGLEILEEAPDVTHVFVSIGGGALFTGIATAIKSLKPGVQVIGVETEGADAMARALSTDAIVEMPAITSIARTLGAPRVCPFTLNHVKRLAREVIVVPDAEAVAALIHILERAKVLCEPASACCLAAARRLRPEFRLDHHIVLLLCGGNVRLADVCSWSHQFA